MYSTYSPSGRFSPVFPLFLFLGLIPITIMAYIYQLGLYWIPLIYINFLLTAGIGFGVGIVNTFIIHWGKIRNVLIAVACSLFLSVVGLMLKYYFQYTTEVAELQSIGLIQNASDFSFLDHITQRAADGWLVGKGNGVPISGVFVYLIWLIEAGIVIGISSLMAFSSSTEPFSEKLNTWADEEEIVMVLPITDESMLQQIHNAQSIDDLLQLPVPKTAESNVFAEYKVNSIPGEEMEDAYLSVELKTITVNKKGEEATNSEELVVNAILTSQQRYQLKENASLLQEAIAAYQQSQMAAAAGQPQTPPA